MVKEEVRKYSVLFSLYLAQSMPTSFFSTAIPVIMRMENYSLESIGYLQLVRLPWILKFLWAPLLDKTSKSTRHFKNWIIAAEVFYAGVILVSGFFDLQNNFQLILIFIFLSFLIAATQDIATDAFAILILGEKEKSLGNSMQVSGNFVGAIIGSGVLLVIYQYFKWQLLLSGLSLLVVLSLIPLLLFKQHREKSYGSESPKISYFEFFHFFRQKKAGAHVLLLFLSYTSVMGILTMFKPYLVDLGYEMKKIGMISGIFGTSIGALIAVPAGYFIRIKGIIKSFWFFSVYNIIVAGYFIFLTYSNHALYLIYVGVALLWSAYAMVSVLIYTLGMKCTRNGREATDFTIQIVIAQLGALLFSSLSGKIADSFGYRNLFILELTIGLLFLGIVQMALKNKHFSKN